ncbi:hypothetical protein RB594_008633 [Gaeumannomyces avenae]
MAPQTLPAQSVPAWKRLGLKLKGAGDTPSTPSAKPAATISGAGSTTGPRDSPSWGNKRKEYPSPSSQFGNSKRPRTDFNQAAQTPGRRKSVTFADGTKGSDLDPSATKTPSKPPGAADDKQQKKPKKPKTRKSAKKPEQNYKPDHLQPQLSQYLRDWHTARDTWKFRKNIQTLVIKYAFDPALLPAADFPIFRKYAIGLQGASRDWLRTSAADIRKRDLEQRGTAGFPAGTTDADGKQERYEELVAKMLGAQGSQARRGSNANGKRVRDDYSEEDLVMGGTEAEARGPEVTQRIVKRMRAEMVLDELSDADASDASAATTSSTTTTTTTTNGASSEGEVATATPSAGEAKAKAADSSQKRRRQRKKRTVDDGDDTSSSDDNSDSSDDEDAGSADEDGDDEEEESDNESTSSSGTSSSGSDSDSSDTASEGTLQRLAQEREALESSSSSSSSSGSDSGSDSDSESEL